LPGTIATFDCPDNDGDGIIDSKDKCPNQKGSIAMEGCPDRDGDGIMDGLDACPNAAGPANNNGTPRGRTLNRRVEFKVEFLEIIK